MKATSANRGSEGGRYNEKNRLCAVGIVACNRLKRICHRRFVFISTNVGGRVPVFVRTI